MTKKETKMRCPTLKELPPPPPGKTGWPWTEESPQLPETLPNGQPWPQISIITPSYNQAQFIEETIRSVLLQGYPNLEYIIMDGGSKDASVEIIRKYEPWLAYWVSEPDKGQGNAVNQGFKRSNGSILAWNNSDDIYEKGALSLVATCMANQPQTDVVYGNAKVVDENGQKIWELRSVPFTPKAFLYKTVHIAAQCAVFWRRELFFKVEMLNEDLKFAMDFELLVKFIEAGAKFTFLRAFLGSYRAHGGSKTFGTSDQSVSEELKIGQYARIRQRPDYAFWRFLYRVRQMVFLFLQGDMQHMGSRIFTWLQN
jgi:glycosyltransferase involved in cell wall biosynthesis